MANQNEERQPQQQQQQQELRSIHNLMSSFVKFVNVTPHDVNVYWIDYSGNPIIYKTLGCQEYIDINTFVTHPWIFVEKETKDRYLANGRSVYFPEAWYSPYRDRRWRSALPERVERVVVQITLPMYTLRENCLRVIKRRLRTDRSAYDLELPRMLQKELYYKRPRKSDLSRAGGRELLLDETQEARGPAGE